MVWVEGSEFRVVLGLGSRFLVEGFGFRGLVFEVRVQGRRVRFDAGFGLSSSWPVLRSC